MMTQEMKNNETDPFEDFMFLQGFLTGARASVRQMMNFYRFVPKMKHGRDDIAYTKAEIELIAKNNETMREFFTNGTMNIRFRDRKRDKNGNIISVEAYYEQETCPVRGDK